MTATLADELVERRRLVRDEPELGRLAARLRALVNPLTAGEIYVPTQKPLLSRDGGVCPTDGARLLFEPFAPRQHRCPVCQGTFEGERHHRAWIWRYHLWLSERAIHLALLAALLDEPPLAARAARILEVYADLYPQMPNKDNVLGPTRLFFSTYLESLWLSQIVVAALILEAQGGHLASRPQLDSSVAASAGLIRTFHEGGSNRQAWNYTAGVAAGLWLGDQGLRQPAADGLRALLASGVTRSGLWHEGENYHFFALRAFALAGELLRWAGDPLPSLRPLYEAPLDTLLPDATLPARGDAPYGVSVAQPRFADLWEVGRRRTASERLEGLLASLYAMELPEGDDHGQADIAEQEVNRPPTRLTRERLSWKALLWMLEAPPSARRPWQGASTAPALTGLVVLRPAPDAFVSLECTAPAGGHGHPDALHLSAFVARGLLADFGTGSYVNPSLHWYRSTLAHNAPAATGMGQGSGVVWCAAFDERDGWSWCQGVAEDVCGPGTRVRRSVVCDAHLIVDIVDVEGPDGALIDLAVHPLTGVRWSPTGEPPARPYPSDAGHDTGYGAVRWLGSTASGHVDGDHLALASRPGEVVLVGEAPGPPTLWFADGPPATFLVRRAAGAGRWVQALFRGPRGRIELSGDDIVVHAQEMLRLTLEPRAVIVRSGDGEPLRLSGARPAPERGRAARARPRPAALPGVLLPSVPSLDEPLAALPADARVVLGEEAYRRSEEPYGARGRFQAEFACYAVGDRMGVVLSVVKAELTLWPGVPRVPPLDNEAAEIHADGLQWYVGGERWRGWLAALEVGGELAIRAVGGTAAEAQAAHGAWRRTDEGYTLVLDVAMPRTIEPGDRIPINVVVNEMYPDRVRRAGQLALSGGGWVYLRGDREPPGTGAVVEFA